MQRDAFFHQLAHRNHRIAIAAGGVDGNRGIHRHQFQGRCDVAAEIDIDHAVDAALPGERHRPGDDVLGLVIDHKIGAGEARLLCLERRTDRRDHPRAAPFCKLHRIMADRAGAAGDQNRLTRNRSIAEQTTPRGHARDAERSTSRERHIVGQRRHQMLGERYVFRCGAERAAVALPVIKPNPPTDLKPRDTVTDLIDNAGAVAVGDHAGKFHRPVATSATAGIGGVDAGGLQPDPDFARSGHRRRHIAKAQHIRRRAGSLIPDGLHHTAFIQSVPGNAPPSSRMFCPVMKPALAPHRNAQARPNSSGSPTRPAGLFLPRSAIN